MQFHLWGDKISIDEQRLASVIKAVAPEFLIDPKSEEARRFGPERVVLKGAILPFRRLIKKYLPAMEWQGDTLSNLTLALIETVVAHLCSNEWEIETRYDAVERTYQIVGLHPYTPLPNAAQGSEEGKGSAPDSPTDQDSNDTRQSFGPLGDSR